MANILIISSGRPHGNTAQLADSFAKGAREAKHQVEIVSLLQTKVEPCLGCNACKRGKPCVQQDDFADDNLFWTFNQATSYYQFAIVNYLGFRNKGMLLAGGCGGSSGEPAIKKTDWLEKAYAFGKNIY